MPGRNTKRPKVGTAFLPLLAAGVLLVPTGPLAGALPASAGDEGESSDPQGWLAWMGCWRTADEAEVDGEALDGVCVHLLEEGQGVRISMVRDRQVVAERIVRTDGLQHPVVELGCEGWQEASWSEDLRRVYLRSELECAGEVGRVTTGAFALSPQGEWIDIQSVRVGDRTDAGAGSQRFTRLSAEETRELGMPPFPTELDLAVRTARTHARAALGLNDVVEASQQLDPEAVQLLLVESQSQLQLTADRIMELHRSGVPEDVIDVAVAVSFPDRFQVDRTRRVAERTPEARPGTRRDRPYYGYDPFRPYRFRPFYDPFFYYDPFFHGGYGYGSRFGPRWGYGYGPIVVIPDRRGLEPSGRVVRDRGYTRGAAQPSSRDDGTRSPPRTSPTRSPNEGRATPPPVNRGSDRQDTGRTARPRGGGGGTDGDGTDG